jgi:ATP-binding cassette subfamily B protein
MSTVVEHSAEESFDARGTDLRLIRRLLGYMSAHRRLFLLALLLYPIDALSVVLPPLLVQQILDEAIPNRDTEMLTVYALTYVAALVVEYASGFSSQLAMSVLGQRAMLSLRSDLFRQVQRLPASYLDRNPIGRVLTRLTNDVEALGDVFATGAVTVIGDLVTIAAVTGMMLWLDVRLTLFAFLVVPPLFCLVLIFRVYARRAFRAIRRHLARINTFLNEHIAGMSVVQIFRQQARTEREFVALNDDYRHANHTAIRFDALLFALVEAIGTAAVAALIWYGAADLSTGLVGAGTLVAFIQYIRRFFVPIRDLSMKYTIIQSALVAAERCFHLLDEKVAIATPPGAERKTSLMDALELRGVWFSYRNPEGNEDWVLRDVDLRVARGERVALVGATGSGKTTLLKLLNRFYDVQRGSVCVDGVDVRQLDLVDLRRLFAVVLQDVHLFTGTVMDNLMLTDDVSEEAVRAAARAVQADSFIARLPAGYQTPVQELGVNFSSGERQLLAFARALALDPEVLVLDEATSNVDSETEARIQTALEVLMRDRTSIIVAHRLSTIRKVDRIVVLQHGAVLEEGDHQTLMRQDGVYRRLVELHFSEGQKAGKRELVTDTLS